MTFERNLVTALGLVFPRFGWIKTREALEKGRWDGQENVYAVRLFTTLMLGGKRTPGEPRGLLEWRNLPMVTETRSRRGQPNLAIKGLLETMGDAYELERSHVIQRDELQPSEAFVAQHPGIGVQFERLGPGAVRR